MTRRALLSTWLVLPWLVLPWLTGPLAAQTVVTWADLRSGRPAECAEFLEMWEHEPDCGKLTAAAAFMTKRLRTCAPGKAALDGAEISIAGFIHPLEFEFEGVRDFLLLPPLRQDCRHPPPPLPDQVIVVRFPPGTDVGADPVWITGRLIREATSTEMAASSYRLEASKIAPATLPEVTTD